jgi:septal ring factor EnvC (AmiA/AmiB activator)
LWRLKPERGWFLLLAFLSFFVLASVPGHTQDGLTPTVPTLQLSQKSNALLDQLEKNSLEIENETRELQARLEIANSKLTEASKALGESEVSRSKIEQSLQSLERSFEVTSRRLRVWRAVAVIEGAVLIGTIITIGVVNGVK